MQGRLTVLSVDGEAQTRDIEVPPYDSVAIDVDASSTRRTRRHSSRSTVGEGSSSRRAVDPAGESVAACANASASTWYLAAGDTLDGSVEHIVLSNPHDYPAVVDVTLATERGVRVPEAYQGFAVPAQSVRVIDVGADVIGDQSRIGVSVVATRGRVVVGRSQLLDTPDRTGYVMTLAAPAARDQWWFVYGEQSDDVVENYYLYNPGDEDAEVTPVLLGFRQPAGMEIPDTIVVPDGEVVEFRMADVGDLPDRRAQRRVQHRADDPGGGRAGADAHDRQRGDDVDHGRRHRPARRLRRQHVVCRHRPWRRHRAGAGGVQQHHGGIRRSRCRRSHRPACRPCRSWPR